MNNRIFAFAVAVLIAPIGCDTRPTEPPVRKTPAALARPPELYQLPLGDSPSRGASAAKVTLVAFSDFQCPFCGRVTKTLDDLRHAYGDELRLVFKHRPLPFHDRAIPAALAAEAARDQGKFWEMHDRLFANPRALGDAALERDAVELGLDVARWKAAMTGGQIRARVDADAALADRLAVQGTPSFFVNGRPLVGAQPPEKFRALIDEELARADAALARGVSRRELYAALTRDGLTKAQPAPARPPEDPDVVVRVDLGDTSGISKGPADAPVTIVEFSDFQCPFCARAEATIDQVLQAYPGKVRLVWQDFPLPFHENAAPAALLARAARREGRFWQLQKELFANQRSLDRAGLERAAVAVGMDAAHVRAALERPGARAELEADVEAAGKLGVRGTPTFFINGHRLVGAQPFERWKTIIDAELARAEGLLAKGTPRSKLYETLMQDARLPERAGR